MLSGILLSWIQAFMWIQEQSHDMISLILVQNIKAGQRGIQYLPLLNILDMFDNEIFTCSGEKKNELTFQLSIMAFICFKMTLDVSFALS